VILVKIVGKLFGQMGLTQPIDFIITLLEIMWLVRFSLTFGDVNVC
jgi:hypothetical protein